MKTILRQENGASLVEFALVMPLLAILISAIINFGHLAINYVNLTMAMNAGIAYAISNPTTTSNIPTKMKSAINDNSLSITTTQFCQCSNGTAPGCTTKCSDNILPGTYVTINASKSLSFLVLNFILPDPFTISASVTVRIK